MLRRLSIQNLVLIREAELEFAPGLNAITGETGAGKTILTQAIGLLLGARGEVASVGAGGAEAYVEAELDLPSQLLEEDDLAALGELRPEGEEELLLARRVFADGRTRAYAWGRSAAREDVAAAAERLIAMSGQFEQRRLARPAYQLDVLDAFAGEEQLRRRAAARRAWRDLAAARRRDAALAADAAAAGARLEELRALAAATEGLEPGGEGRLREERERLRHAEELVGAVALASERLAPEDGEGAALGVAEAARAIATVEAYAPELARSGEELRDLEVRLRETATDLRAFLLSLEDEPGRLEAVEEALEGIAEAKRRFRRASYEELVASGAQARTALAQEGEGGEGTAAAALAAAEARMDALTGELRAARGAAAEPLAAAVAGELRDVGLGAGEFRVELGEREPGPTGADGVAFLIRPNAGLPFAPVAATASGGELSRVALAIAAVAGGETLVFDEIDAGIGGRTAVAVGQTLRRLAERAQVITITHLPQIASLADRHFRVEKVPGEPTHTRIQALGADERRAELERMLGGAEFLATLR